MRHGKIQGTKITNIPYVCRNFDSIEGFATGCVTKAYGQDVALNKVLPATQTLCSDCGC
jgi:hypothetical protein